METNSAIAKMQRRNFKTTSAEAKYALLQHIFKYTAPPMKKFDYLEKNILTSHQDVKDQDLEMLCVLY